MKIEEFEAVKRLPIVQFLAAINVVPAKKIRDEWGYRSPLREENTPSFFVNVRKNSWYDFGLGVGGNLIDLAMRLFSADYKTAGQMLTQISLNPHLLQAADKAVVEYERNRAAANERSQLVINRSGELQYGVLCNYLASRKINLPLIKSIGRIWSKIREVFYFQPGQKREKPYFAIGFVNESGGMELRAPGFQNCYGTKDVTYFRGKQPGVAIFEGFTDYLAAVTIRKRDFQCSVLVLNSLVNVEKSLHLVQNEPLVHAFLDNDQMGLRALATYRKKCPNAVFQCHNETYRGFKDVNDFLMGKKPDKPLPIRGDRNSDRSQTAKWWLWVVLLDPATGKRRECTFYAYNNTQAGYDALVSLRHRIQDEVVLSRLCERTVGRQFTYQQLWHFLPQERAQTAERRHHQGLTSTYERILHDTPRNRATA